MSANDVEFADLLRANRTYAQTEFNLTGADGVARAGVAMVTCMDSRIDPLRMLGLRPGDAKIFRNLGGRVTDETTRALTLAVHLLGVHRVLIVGHTRCAMVAEDAGLSDSTTPEEAEAQLTARVVAASSVPITTSQWGVITHPEQTIRDDVTQLRANPQFPDQVRVIGFRYDVDTGLLNPV